MQIIKVGDLMWGISVEYHDGYDVYLGHIHTVTKTQQSLRPIGDERLLNVGWVEVGDPDYFVDARSRSSLLFVQDEYQSEWTRSVSSDYLRGAP